MYKWFAILISLALFAGCSKNETDDNVASVKATIDYLGDPATGGFGWTLRTGTDFEVPVNLSDEYKIDELNVNVVYRRTDQLFPCRCNNRKLMVEIVTISKD